MVEECFGVKNVNGQKVLEFMIVDLKEMHSFNGSKESVRYVLCFMFFSQAISNWTMCLLILCAIHTQIHYNYTLVRAK